jgi:CHAD domain-containing protein
MAIKETLERELKLTAGEAFRLPELGGEAIEPRLFVSTYHDTFDHRLARRGITLRHRVEDGVGLWQLKLPAGAARLELEEPGVPSEPPDQLVGLLAGHLRSARLLPIARLRTRREGVRADGAEIVHDTVAVLDHERVTRSFEELEVELLEGDEKTLRRLERELRRAGAADGESRPKVFQALDLDFQAEPVEDGDDRSAASVLRTRLREQAEELLAHDPGTRLGTDPEELHKMRVATRRLRAFLRAGHDLLDPVTAEPLRDELRWLGSSLGPVRDLDVLVEHLQGEIQPLGPDLPEGRKLVRTLERRRRSARRRLLSALESPRYFALLDSLERPFATVADGPSLAEIKAKEHKKLRTAVKGLGLDPSDEELHATRIRAKRARYAAELEGDKPYVREAKKLQDILGEHQDAVVATAALRDLARRMPDSAVAAGRLIEGEYLRARRRREEWKTAWKRLAQTV